GQEADREVYRIDPGVVTGRRTPRPRAPSGRGTGAVEYARRRAQDHRRLTGGDYMSQALNGLRAMVSPPKYSLPIPHPPDGRPRLDGVIGWSRMRAVAGGRRRWAADLSADSLRWNLDLVLDQRGVDMADLLGDASGCWCATTRGRKPTGS